MPLRPLLKNKLLLQKHYHVNEYCIDEWPFWMLEENISIINELTDEEEKQRKKEEYERQDILCEAKNTRKQLEELENELSFYESYQPVNNMGKWSTAVRIESLQKQIDKLKKKIEKIKEE